MESEQPESRIESRESESDLVTQLLSVSRYIAAEALISSTIHALRHRLLGLHDTIRSLLLEQHVRGNRLLLDVLGKVDQEISKGVKEIEGAYRFARGSEVEAPASCHVQAEITRTGEIWKTYLHQAKCVLQLRLEADDDQARIAPAHLQEILSILLVNAVQARSTVVSVTTAFRKELRVSEICTLRPALEVLVADNGMGVLNVGHPDEIFEPGYTTKAGRDAVGLGLFIARTLARQAGGELSYIDRSKPRGAAFSLALTLGEH